MKARFLLALLAATVAGLPGPATAQHVVNGAAGLPGDRDSALGGWGFEPGGSNFHYWYLAPAYWTVANPGLELIKPGAIHMAVGDLHACCGADGRDGIAHVRDALAEMYRNGQRKISLPLYFIRPRDRCEFLTDAQCREYPAVPDDYTSGLSIYVDTSNAEAWTFPPQVMTNLKTLMGEVHAAGFNEVQVRFIPLSHTFNPIACARWYDASKISQVWSIERSVMDTVNHALQGTGVRAMYDLGAEFAGYQWEAGNSSKPGCGDGRTRIAMRELWRSYACRAENGGWPFTTWTGDSAMAHTVGFTFAGRVRRHGRNENHNQVIYDQVTDIYDGALRNDSSGGAATYACGGPWRPAVYGFDIYPTGSSDNWGLDNCRGSCLDHDLFAEIATQLTRLGNVRHPIALWEVPYNSELVYRALRDASANLCLNIRTVMQWPAEWRGKSAPKLGSPRREMPFNVPATPGYIYNLPPCARK